MNISLKLGKQRMHDPTRVQVEVQQRLYCASHAQSVSFYRRIKALREEIAAVRQQREAAEKEARSITSTNSMIDFQIKFFQDRKKIEKERCAAIEKRIQEDPLAPLILGRM